MSCQPQPARLSQLPAWLVLLVCSAAVGCAEKKVICPVGFEPQGTYCYPVGQAGGADTSPQDTGATATDSGVVDTGVQDSGGLDAGVQDSGTPDTGVADTGAPDTGAKDTGPGDTGPSSPIGAACTDDLDCFAGLSCFSYPKGYCTVLNCSASSACPGSAVCWGKDDKSQLCLADCEDAGDCRVADGYGCKRLTAKFGGVDAHLCLPGGAALHGQVCTTPLDCEGDDTCLTDMPGGYCGRVGCSANDPCDNGTACVLREGKPTCLKVCTTDTTCQVKGNHPRKCVERSDLSKKVVKVCLDTAKAAPIGATCGADLDCASGKCTLVANGGCKTGGAPCLVDGQCGSDGPCVPDKSKETGVCSQPCANDKGCPTSSACVPGADSPLSGTCQPVCQGPGDSATCKTPGTECVFGQPIAPPNGTALAGYACAPRPKGKPGSNCTALADCESNDCTTNSQGTAGYCSASCGSGKAPCPYGTKCINTGLAFCERMCSGDYDCPPQMACKSSAQPGLKTCQLP